ncbi:MAG: hypothetical protein GY765_08385, partial [bacterium]|nr:hypothetical protein [bacterium]
WQNKKEAEGVMQKQEDFWKETFAGEIPVLQLQYDYPRPPVQRFEGARQATQLSVRETAAMKKIAADHEVTLYMVLLTIYTILLAKLSGGEDIVVGTPTAGRGHADLQKIVGMFVNTLALRNRPENGKTFATYLAEVGKTTLQAFENQEYPFEEL